MVPQAEPLLRSHGCGLIEYVTVFFFTILAYFPKPSLNTCALTLGLGLGLGLELELGLGLGLV